jgi:hypothetical protein
MCDSSIIPSEKDFESAFARSVARYIEECRGRIRPFLERHFGFRGSLIRHRAVLGWDLLRAPLNLAWGFVLMLVKLSGLVAGFFGFLGFRACCDGFCRRCPGFRTELQRNTERLFYHELLMLPWPEELTLEVPQRNRLAEILLEQPEFTEFREVYEQKIRSGDRKLAEALEEFGKSQGAAADLFSNVTVVIGTFVGTQSLVGGALGAGGLIAKQIAIHTFWLGPAIGGVWYGLFKRKVDPSLVLSSVVAVVLAVSVLAAFAGLVTDPFQTFTGIHRRRLNRILKTLETALIRENSSAYTSKSPFLARILDLADTVASLSR